MIPALGTKTNRRTDDSGKKGDRDEDSDGTKAWYEREQEGDVYNDNSKDDELRRGNDVGSPRTATTRG